MEVEKFVLRYFVQNPQAADSVEGIVRWRLLEQVAASTVDETHDALRRLVDQGLLTEESAPGMQTLYRLNPDAPAPGGKGRKG
jgi:hypothetical protein